MFYLLIDINVCDCVVINGRKVGFRGFGIFVCFSVVGIFSVGMISLYLIVCIGWCDG